MEQEYYFQTKWEQWPVHFTHVQSEYVSLSNDLLASENWAFYIKMAVIPNRLKWYFFFFFFFFALMEIMPFTKRFDSRFDSSKNPQILWWKPKQLENLEKWA